MLSAHPRSSNSGKAVGRQVLGDFGAPRVIRLCADLLAILAAFGASFWLYETLLSGVDSRVVRPEGLQGFVLVYSAAVIGTFAVLGLYRPRASVLNLWEVATALKGLFVASALVAFATYGFRFGDVPRFIIVSGALGASVLILLERRVMAAILRTRQLRGVLGRRVLIAGAGRTGRLLMKRLIDAPHDDRTVVGFLDDSAPLGSTVTCTTDQTTNAVIRRSVLGRSIDLKDVATVFDVDEVLVDAASVPEVLVPGLLDAAKEQGLRFGFVPHLGELRADRLGLEALGGIPVLVPRQSGIGLWYRIMSRIFDLALAGAVLVLSAPLWLLLAALIKLDSPGPVLFAQNRVGLGGRTFRMFKFRSMRQDTEAYANSPRGDGDPRITRIGRFLRMGGLDELPQVLNVLKGEMSVVGPRPEMEFIVAGYTAHERRRLQVKPGITGIWQISPDRHGEIHHNVEYDLYYIDYQSLLLDALILFETAVRTGEMVMKGLLARGSTQPVGDVYEMPSDFELRTAHVDDGPTVEEGTLVLEHGARWRRDYLLVALDQRTADHGRPASWAPVCTAAFAISCRWPVKMVAAQANRPALNGILEKARHRMGSGQARIAYVTAENEWEIRAHIASAALLVTDVEIFTDWAMEMGVSSYLHPSGQRRVVRGPVSVRAVEELDRWLETSRTPAATPHLSLISPGEPDDE